MLIYMVGCSSGLESIVAIRGGGGALGCQLPLDEVPGQMGKQQEAFWESEAKYTQMWAGECPLPSLCLPHHLFTVWLNPPPGGLSYKLYSKSLFRAWNFQRSTERAEMRLKPNRKINCKVRLLICKLQGEINITLQR